MLRRTRRAPKACSWCHHRKVRCDASIRGCPCTRCRQDGRPECVLRGKLPRNFTFPFPSQQDENLRSAQIDPDIIVSKTTASLPQPALPGHVSYTTYPFLEFSEAPHLAQEDVAYLARKGCLSVPDKSVIHDFAKQYFVQIHPSMPVLDEAEFWAVYLRPEDGEDADTEKMSLVVFQALLFVASPYVSLGVIQQCGFEDHRAARNTFFKRAKLLYDLGAEPRPFIKAQAATMLSHHTSAAEPQAGSLWLTRAIQNAMIIGLRPSFGPMEDVDPALKKRLWWSIILRDRSLCLGLRRRGQVTAIEFGMAAEPLDEGDFGDEIGGSCVYDASTKRMLVRVLKEQCRLAVLLTEMIGFVFASHGISIPVLGGEEYRGEIGRIVRVRRAMGQWERCAKLSGFLEDENVPEMVRTMTQLAYMFYQTARIDLAHYEAMLVENHLLLTGHNYLHHLVHVGSTLHDAMDQLTQVMEYFSREGRAQSLPLSVLAYVSMPLVLTALDTKLSPSSAEMDTRRGRLNALGEIIRHSARVYDVTDFVSTGTNHILQLAYLTSQHLFVGENAMHSGEIEQHEEEADEVQSMSTSSTSPVYPSSSNPYSSYSYPCPPTPRRSNMKMKMKRPQTWHEAFLRHPRAYLLISTSVDYSLSVGRLPYDTALPELVRSIPPMGIGIRLPWMISSVPAGVERKKRRKSRRVSVVDLDGNSPEKQGEGSSMPLSLPPMEQMGSGSEVNLDYLFLDGAESGSAAGSVHSLSSPGMDYGYSYDDYTGDGMQMQMGGDSVLPMSLPFSSPSASAAAQANAEPWTLEAAAGLDPLVGCLGMEGSSLLD